MADPYPSLEARKRTPAVSKAEMREFTLGALNNAIGVYGETMSPNQSPLCELIRERDRLMQEVRDEGDTDSEER